MEKYWEMMSGASRLAHIGSVGYLFYRFVKPYLKRDSSAKAIGIAYCAAMAIVCYIPWEINGIAAYGIGAWAAFLTMCVVDPRNKRQKLFLAVTMYLLEGAASGAAIVPTGFLFERLSYLPAILQRDWPQLGCFFLIEIFHLVMRFLLMAFFIKIVNKVYVGKKENMSGKELALMLATPALILTGYWAFQFFSSAWLEAFEQYVWNAYGQYLWIKALYQAAAYFAVITTIILYQSIKESHRKEKENAVLAGRMADMKKYIGHLEDIYEDIRGLKHDMNNHVSTLEALLAQKEHRQAEEYLQSLREQLNEIVREIKTGNAVTDVILTEKRKEAEKKGIDFQCDFHFPEKTKINAFDVSVILNNGIDNALEAVGGQGGAAGKNAKDRYPEEQPEPDRPYIRIKSWRQKNAYMIEIQNSFSGNILTDEESGLPESTKSGQGHGFGLVNIRKVAHRYQGEIDIMKEESYFLLSVMLMTE